MYRGVEVVATAEDADPFAHPGDGGGLPAVAADGASQALLGVHELRVRPGLEAVCALDDRSSESRSRAKSDAPDMRRKDPTLCAVEVPGYRTLRTPPEIAVGGASTLGSAQSIECSAHGGLAEPGTHRERSTVASRLPAAAAARR